MSGRKDAPGHGQDEAGWLVHAEDPTGVSIPPKPCTRPLTPAMGAVRSPTTRRTSATAAPSARGTTAAVGITTGTADRVSIPGHGRDMGWAWDAHGMDKGWT